MCYCHDNLGSHSVNVSDLEKFPPVLKGKVCSNSVCSKKKNISSKQLNQPSKQELLFHETLWVLEPKTLVLDCY